jgi:hypothetical protein
MKYLFSILLLISALCSTAQSKKVREVLYNTTLLERAVFETKDSAALEKLFATTLSYEHSNGKVQSREEALEGIIHNKSVYIMGAIIPTATNVLERGDSIITKKVFQATERKPDGTESHLDLVIEMVWIKEKGNWKLARRKATKNQ